MTMSVAEKLGFSAKGPETVNAETWQQWCRQHPVLARFDNVDGLREWVRSAPVEESGEVLWALAQLAAEDGGDDLDAARWLAWILLGGITLLGRRLRGVGDLDHQLAVALWLEVRTFPWRTRRRVAGNIYRGVRVRVLADAGRSCRREDPGRHLLLVPSPLDLQPFCPELPDDEDPADELAALLDWACEKAVIPAARRALLQCLVQTWHHTDAQVKRGPHQGLLSREVTLEVARRSGLSTRTVRRHTAAALAALSAAAPHYSRSA